MTAALALFGYALAVAWLLPPLLARLTSSGVSVRLGLAAWLVAMVSSLVAAGLGLQFLFRTLRADWTSLTRLLCRSVAGDACTPVVYRSGLYELGVAAVVALVTVAAAVALWRYGRRVQRAQRSTREHAETALIAGRPLPGTGAVVLDDPRPAAYCVPGRPAAIVLTSGALAVLDTGQLAAVLAHERAHLAGRHHAVVLLTRGLAAVLPGVPLFTRAAAEVARLAEMSADDRAARTAGRGTLVAALLAIATGAAVPALALPSPAFPSPALPARALPRAGLAAATYAVLARIERMLAPPRPACHAAVGLALAAVLTALAVMPVALTVLAANH
jgi:Zn-dependent protease with chaperone function